MKVSKVVLIVVALHVLVIGGFLLFEAFNREKPIVPDIAHDESQPGQLTEVQTNATAVAPILAPGADTAMLTPAQPGLALVPPSTTAGVTPSPAPATRTYAVKKGDSLWKIAKAEGVNMSELARVNNLTKSSVLQVGQSLQLPAATTAESVNIATGNLAPMTAAPSIAGDVAASPDLYVVQSGDSLWKLARQHKTSVAAIKQANGLSADTLKIGQKLRIPSGSITASTVPASNGNASPAVAAGASWNYNDYREPGSFQEEGRQYHAVNHGESLEIIARRYGVKTADLQAANRITDPKTLKYGQVLVIPQAQTAPAAGPATMAGTM